MIQEGNEIYRYQHLVRNGESIDSHIITLWNGILIQRTLETLRTLKHFYKLVNYLFNIEYFYLLKFLVFVIYVINHIFIVFIMYLFIFKLIKGHH